GPVALGLDAPLTVANTGSRHENSGFCQRCLASRIDVVEPVRLSRRHSTNTRFPADTVRSARPHVEYARGGGHIRIRIGWDRSFGSPTARAKRGAASNDPPSDRERPHALRASAGCFLPLNPAIKPDAALSFHRGRAPLSRKALDLGADSGISEPALDDA